MLTRISLLSPDGKSYAFDSRASGYGRGEGIATIILKPLEDALRDGDPVRAIIRHTGANQDGKSSTITSPNQSAQEELIRSCYRAAGLDPVETGYVEAHGTGTQTGDSIEAGALGGRPSREAKAVDQQYLYPYEEKAVSDFLTQCGILGQPVRVKYIPAIAFSVTRHRPEADRPLKPPHYSWAKRFEKRRMELVIRKNKPQAWNRYNIYDKVVYWFKVIGAELHKPEFLLENVYNMDETGVMLSILNSIRVLVSKADI